MVERELAFYSAYASRRSELAKRLKGLGVEKLAGVKFDTTSWIFMDHEPVGQWQDLLRTWAKDWKQPLTK